MFWDECWPRQWKIYTLILLDTEILVAPVPLHARKLRQRGFNQSELIARSALKLKSAGGRFHLSANLLERCRETTSQIGLSRHQRRENIRGAFRVTKPDELNGREVLVVDDVFTTGTTVSECARILRRAGASKVYVAHGGANAKDRRPARDQGIGDRNSRSYGSCWIRIT